VSAPGPLPPALVRRRRVQLVALAMVFAGPLVLAFALYYGGRFSPAGRLNRGVLVEPARPLPEVDAATPGGDRLGPGFLRHKWSLVVFGEGRCAQPCQQALAVTLTVQRALQADAPRVQRVLLVAPGCCASTWRAGGAGLVTAVLDSPDGRRLGGAFAVGGAPAAEAGRIYLVDPLGNLMMSYPPGAQPRFLSQDLEKLLRLSRIG
jgi:hypothetical protein